MYPSFILKHKIFWTQLSLLGTSLARKPSCLQSSHYLNFLWYRFLIVAFFKLKQFLSLFGCEFFSWKVVLDFINIFRIEIGLQYEFEV